MADMTTGPSTPAIQWDNKSSVSGAAAINNASTRISSRSPARAYPKKITNQ